MQFKVPQFLDIEDKIFGPFTFRQFVYLAGGGGLCFVLYKLFGLVFAAIPILLVAAFAGALAFYRPNNKPFAHMLEAGFKYLTQNKLYIWKHHLKPEGAAPERGAGAAAVPRSAQISSSRLQDLAWSLDVLDLTKNKNPGS